jgi:hypothetical protein
MSRTDTAVRVISASPDRVFAALTDPDALAEPRLGIPTRDTGRRFRSDTQCERPARRPSRAWFGRRGAAWPTPAARRLRGRRTISTSSCDIARPVSRRLGVRARPSCGVRFRTGAGTPSGSPRRKKNGWRGRIRRKSGSTGRTLPAPWDPPRPLGHAWESAAPTATDRLSVLTPATSGQPVPALTTVYRTRRFRAREGVLTLPHPRAATGDAHSVHTSSLQSSSNMLREAAVSS